MNGTYPFITATRIFRRRYRVTTATRNNGVAACHVLGAGDVMMGGGTSHVFVDRELPLNVEGWQRTSPK